MRQVIEQNSSETITVVTDKHRLAIATDFKGELPPNLSRHKVTILNKRQVRHLLPIASNWVNK